MIPPIPAVSELCYTSIYLVPLPLDTVSVLKVEGVALFVDGSANEMATTKDANDVLLLVLPVKPVLENGGPTTRDFSQWITKIQGPDMSRTGASEEQRKIIRNVVLSMRAFYANRPDVDATDYQQFTEQLCSAAIELSIGGALEPADDALTEILVWLYEVLPHDVFDTDDIPPVDSTATRVIDPMPTASSTYMPTATPHSTALDPVWVSLALALARHGNEVASSSHAPFDAQAAPSASGAAIPHASTTPVPPTATMASLDDMARATDDELARTAEEILARAVDVLSRADNDIARISDDRVLFPVPERTWGGVVGNGEGIDAATSSPTGRITAPGHPVMFHDVFSEPISPEDADYCDLPGLVTPQGSSSDSDSD